MKKESIEKILPAPLRDWFQTMKKRDIKGLQEIRLRVGKPVIIYMHNQEYYVSENELVSWGKNRYVVTDKDIKETMEFISNYSLYAFEDEVRHGYITIEGGHRVGLSGKVIVENRQVKTIKYISCINIRISHEIKGCSDSIMTYLFEDHQVLHTLIISPPKCGKTTLLRDIIRQLSNGYEDQEGITVGVVDERSELGGCYRGVPQNDIGMRTDILDGCPKTEGMLMLIRSMSPAVIAVDEIGSSEDIDAIDFVMNAGSKIICTVHGANVNEVKDKPILGKLMDKGVIERFIVLENKNGIGDMKKVYDKQYKLIGMVVEPTTNKH
ncbi:stage III sporulation protein AA [Vallitalea pronyensis]|uniref:Stage III sporulation protein AA n=1 Tax=Vallitalea pronyensis TaxID=1348613 RepID=A0A8J8MM61_9FIRM|nr:stage III sporulation protein AA [Vallitalea pronyensis]QUI23813.1 stage III sporulation protein AA [Vallitalea pronyensis]